MMSDLKINGPDLVVCMERYKELFGDLSVYEENALEIIKLYQAAIDELESSNMVLNKKCRELEIIVENRLEIKSDMIADISAHAIECFMEKLIERYSQADILCPRYIISLTQKELFELGEEMGVKYDS